MPLLRVPALESMKTMRDVHKEDKVIKYYPGLYVHNSKQLNKTKKTPGSARDVVRRSSALKDEGKFDFMMYEF